jgi:ABC-type antimicrobial peptide transport system permease subunit
VAGRVFDDRDRDGPPVVVVSEAIAKQYFPDGSPIGRAIRAGDGTAEIVGVVGDIRRAGLADQPRADLYFPWLARGTQTTLFVRTSSDPKAPFPAIRAALREIEPNTVLAEPRTMAEIASESVRVTQLLLGLLGVFAVTALLLAAVGIYGVMSCVVRQRTREIGTRIALGASRSAILGLVLRQGGTLAGFGIAIGVMVGLGVARVLQSLLYGASAFDPIVLGGAAVVLIGTSLLACYLPARRAASVDPIKTLAQE